MSFNEDSVSLDDSMNSEDQKDVLKQLAASIAIQVESTKESNKISRLEFKRKVENDKANKDSMGKLHSAVRHQFLMAASTDGEEPAEELPKSCKDFYNRESAPLSSQELTEQLGTMGCQDVGFGQGTIQSLLAGLLRYNAPGSPGNHSVFCFYENL